MNFGFPGHGFLPIEKFSPKKKTVISGGPVSFPKYDIPVFNTSFKISKSVLLRVNHFSALKIMFAISSEGISE